jgi:hypothetical protein
LSRNAVLQSLLLYHVFGFLLVFLSKTLSGDASSMDLLSNVVHFGMAIWFGSCCYTNL